MRAFIAKDLFRVRGKHTSRAKAPIRAALANAGAEALAYLESDVVIPPFSQNTRKGRGTPKFVTPRIILIAAAASTVFVAGCRQDMHNQPKVIPQRGSEMFADHRSARPAIENTVARGSLHGDSYFYTGVVLGANGYREEKDMLPFPVTMTVLKKGQERFNIYCTPCHSRVGNGVGAIVLRGYKPAGNLNDQVRRAQPLSHYFYVMTHGYGAMPDYSAQLTPEERWSVAAYICAIQLSQNATSADVASGAKVEKLKDIAAARGLPEGFAEPWTLPAPTAIQAYPADAKQGTPGMGPAYPGDPKVFIPHSAAPASTKPTTSKPASAPVAPTTGNPGAR